MIHHQVVNLGFLFTSMKRTPVTSTKRAKEFVDRTVRAETGGSGAGSGAGFGGALVEEVPGIML